MKVSLTKENSIAKAVVTFDKNEWLEAQEKAYAKLGKNVEVKGFRKGHAPLEQVKRRVDPAQMIETASDILLPKGYEKVLEENKDLDIILRPEVSFNKVSMDELEVTYILTLRPEVKLGQYKDIEIKKDEVTASEAEVEAAIKELVKNNAEISVKEDGIIEKGSLVNFDFEGFVDGVAFEGGKAEKFDLEVGSGQFIPGFEDQMIGLVRGEEKDITVTFPAQYTKELAGKEAVFKLKINEVSTKVLPEVNDDLALDANIDGVNNLEELKAHYAKQIEAKKAHEVEEKALNELVAKISEDSVVELPETLVKEDVEENYKRHQQRIAQMGIPFEKYLELANFTEEDFKKQVELDSVKNLKTMFVLAQIAKENGIDVKDADIDEEISKIAAQYSLEADKVKEMLKDRISDLANQIYSRKVTDYIKSVNKLV